MGLNTEAKAALVFLILYTILLAILLLGYFTRRLRFHSRYTAILCHVTVSLASLATGLAYGVVGYTNASLLLAYFTLGAESYYILLICTYCFLMSWQRHNFASHNEWLISHYPPGTLVSKRLMSSFTFFMFFAFMMIMIGGTTLSAGVAGPNVPDFNGNFTTSKALRTTGMSVLLASNIFFLYCITDTIRQSRRENPGKGIHPTLFLLLATWPLLFVRGLYGVMSGFVPAFNYLKPNYYTATGMSDSSVISGYIMGTTMEWISCSLLMATYFTSRNDPKTVDFEMHKREEAQSGDGTA